MKSVSVRAKLTLLNIAVLALTLGALGLAVFFGARASLLNSVHRDLMVRAGHMVERLERPGVIQRLERPGVIQREGNGVVLTGVSSGQRPHLHFPGSSPNDYMAFLDHGGGEYVGIDTSPRASSTDPTRTNIHPRLLNSSAETSSGERAYDLDSLKQAWLGRSTTIETYAANNPGEKATEHIMLLTEPVHVDGKIVRVLQVPVLLSATDQALTGLTKTLLIALPSILLVAALGGAFLTGRALKPVRDITETAAQVSAESLDGRLEVRGNDEFSRLAETFNGMLSRLQGAFTRMEQAVEQQRRFTADASHELRTPLTVIKANTSLAMKGKRTAEEYKKTLAAVDAAADSMNRLVYDLLLLARSDTGKLEIHLEPVCLKPLLTEAIASVARPGVAPIELHAGDEGAEILGDGHMIVRVFVNLLENAARYTPETGRIEVEQSREGDEAVVAVKDTGLGIAPEHLPHLMDRFYRADDARARTEGGSGLGLSICKSIVDAHHGTISIDSVVDKGTTVTVRLPIASTELF
ncbi:MAG TPA: ATP-binding protein [Fimbriimonadaceae bacterium]|nr:ATP-binding protein [Fimbriimonadaceae bacterium]